MPAVGISYRPRTSPFARAEARRTAPHATARAGALAARKWAIVAATVLVIPGLAVQAADRPRDRDPSGVRISVRDAGGRVWDISAPESRASAAPADRHEARAALPRPAEVESWLGSQMGGSALDDTPAHWLGTTTRRAGAGEPRVAVGSEGLAVEAAGVHIRTAVPYPAVQGTPARGLLFSAAAWRTLAAAREAFRHGRYAQAERLAQATVADMPADPNVQQLYALTLLANGHFESAADALHAALAHGAAWNWETLRRCYGDEQDYKEHCRALQQAVERADASPQLRFLAAFHQLMRDTD